MPLRCVRLDKRRMAGARTRAAIFAESPTSGLSVGAYAAPGRRKARPPRATDAEVLRTIIPKRERYMML